MCLQLSLSQQGIAICFPKSSALVSITTQGSINKDQPGSLQDMTEHKISLKLLAQHLKCPVFGKDA